MLLHFCIFGALEEHPHKYLTQSMSARQESNLNLYRGRELFFPLNYGQD